MNKCENIQEYVPIQKANSPDRFPLIVGYEEYGNILFFSRIIHKTPEIDRDTKIFGLAFYGINKIDIIKRKLQDFSFLVRVGCLRETFNLEYFKDEYGVYLCYCDDAMWYAYDPDWRSWHALKKYYGSGNILDTA